MGGGERNDSGCDQTLAGYDGMGEHGEAGGFVSASVLYVVDAPPLTIFNGLFFVFAVRLSSSLLR